MALRTSLVAQPHLYMGDTQGRPLDAGKVYFGQPNKDPELYPINVFYDEALTIAAPQPIRTMGGFMNANGQMVEIYAAETEYSVKVLDGYGRQVFYQAAMNSTSTSGSVSTKQPFANAVVRTQDEKNTETVSIEDFGASTSNADNTTQINNAYAYALASGASIYIPVGVFNTVGRISSFHNVRLYGDGKISSNGEIYSPTPVYGVLNTIFISPTGNGDGLSRQNAASVSNIPSILKNIGVRALSGQWRLLFTAGNYTDKGLRFTDIPVFGSPLLIEGELDSSGNHATIWDGTLSAEPIAFRCDLRSVGIRANFKDIKFTNWNAEAGNAGAIVFWGHHDVITENIYVKDSIIGVWTSRNSTHKSWGDTYENCSTWGMCCQYSSSVVIGLTNKRTKFIGCGKGLFLGRASIAHLDYADFDGNDYDVGITQASRISIIDPTHKNWKYYAFYAQNLAIIEFMQNCRFDENSISDTTPILYTENTAQVDIMAGKGSTVLHQPFVPTVPRTVTGTSLTQLNLESGFDVWTRFPRYMLYQGSKLTITMQARIQGTNETAGSYYSLCADGAEKEFLRFALPAGGYNGVINATLDFRGDGAIYAYGTLTSSHGLVFVSKTITASTHNTFRDKSKNNTAWRIYLKMASATDSFTYISQKTWITY